MSKKLTAAAIPDKMKALPFCCWKREKNQQGEETKVPYNPKTGNRAKVDVPATFGTLKEALSAWGSGKYAGLGFNISDAGNAGMEAMVGGIDLDDCVNDFRRGTGCAWHCGRRICGILAVAYRPAPVFPASAWICV